MIDNNLKLKKNKIAFIDHSYHKKTKSTNFFINLLKKNFNVKVFWCNSWKRRERIQFTSSEFKEYDIIIFCQQMYPVEFFKKIRDKKIIFIPMYDSVYKEDISFWLKYVNFKFICFSKVLYSKLRKIGIDCLYVQYFLPSNFSSKYNKEESNDKFSCCFWQRTNKIKWTTIKKLLSKNKVDEFNLHLAVDPCYKEYFPTNRDIKRYNIKVTKWFKNRKDYLDKIKKSKIYFAPRMYEGIGLSFLEAMSLGKCIVAPNKPTMNEYIKDGINGILYNPKKLKPIDFKNIDTIIENVKEFNDKGYKKWEQNEYELIDFIEKKETNRRKILKFIKYKFYISLYTILPGINYIKIIISKHKWRLPYYVVYRFMCKICNKKFQIKSKKYSNNKEEY